MKKISLRIAFPLTLLLTPAWAQQEPGVTRSQADRILDELVQIRQLLENQAKAPRPLQEPVTRLKLDIDGAPVLGAKDAPVTVVEFTDYQCPFCQSFHLATFALLKRDYIESGKVRFVGRDLPLTEVHPLALGAAQAARCAGDQGQYWELRDRLHRSGSALEVTNLVEYASALKLDLPSFRSCLDTGKYKSAVEKDLATAISLGVDATPSFVIGQSTATGVDGELISGALPYELFSAKLKALLAAPSPR